jgi:16S rRNA A1518/A1519 N6-dimethyltransferase RsmA/KsgA/DIM1 with predicted DNA glycosylase/AP lyase activity
MIGRRLLNQTHHGRVTSSTYGGSFTRPLGRGLLRASKYESDTEAAAVPQVGWMWDAPARGAAANSAGATRANLKAANIKAKKSLGQNFLTDEATLAAIVRAAGIGPGDAVLEVGPGTGNLTRRLVATGARVVAVEKDDVLVERLRGEFAGTPNIELVHGDILRVGIDGVLRQLAAAQGGGGGGGAFGSGSGTSTDSNSSTSSSTHTPQREQQPGAGTSGRGGGSVKVVANLPYNITKEFLRAALPLGGIVSELSIMVQHEVAERLVDPTPGRPDYRAMSVYTHYYSRPRYRLRIPRHKYFPVPGVDGALVTFALAPPAARVSVPDERRFHSVVAKAFSERRKMMRNSMQPLFAPAQVEAALRALKLRPDARAQDLSVAQFAAFAWELERLKSGGSGGSGDGSGEPATEPAAEPAAAVDS